jgi:hypothetical protein
MCEIDQLLWQPLENNVIVEGIEEGEMKETWRELVNNWVRD